jgi:8-oxo-dGTP pyrophosphatase MutT (NUDIX family)
MVILAYFTTIWNDWLAKMIGPLSLILLFVPLLAPDFTTRYMVSNTLVWLVALACLIFSTFRAWLNEHRARMAGKLDPLIKDAGMLRELWEQIQYDHKDSEFVRFPLAPFTVEKWTETHKQLLRLYFWTGLQAQQLKDCFNELGITEPPRLFDLMNNQDARRSITALQYSKLLEEHTDLLRHHQDRARHLATGPRPPTSIT